MDDDGFVLNIAEGPISAGHSGNKKGGRWTDRVKAKRLAKRKHTQLDNALGGVASTPTNEIDQNSGPPIKKPRRSEASMYALPSVSTPQATTSQSTQRRTFISSLFTANPDVAVTANASSQPTRTTKPSNAPLTDRSTFAGLALNPLIVAHLFDKMHISKPTSVQRDALSALLMSPDDPSSVRDAFITSQTGSGKTLAYLLPILQDLLPLSSLSYINRSIGTLAIILAPTRELAKQISDVLDSLLVMRLRPMDETPDEVDGSSRLTRWLVSGLLTGGHTRAHEKARIRKGLPIIIATPGRLLDHLQNTSSLNVSKCRWLVLDEADRLMELGFKDTLDSILRALEGRRKLAMQAVEEGKSTEVGGWDWNVRRRTILCSATIREDVQQLAGTTLLKPVIVKPGSNEPVVDNTAGNAENRTQGDESTELSQQKFSIPSQLSQKFVVVPLKLRLVALVAVLRSLLSQSRGLRAAKIIVFFSCIDSVDFHWNLFGSSSIDSSASDDSEDSDEGEGDGKSAHGSQGKGGIALRSNFLPGTSIYRLHGSLPLQTRLSTIKGFSSGSSSEDSSILFCTSVASRGLDLPLVRAVVQYDLPTENGATEYVHRIGRTARVGKGGAAWSFVTPSEQEWVPWIQERLRRETGANDKSTSLEQVAVDDVLRNGFGGEGKEYERRATQTQLAFERWVLQGEKKSESARKAYQSHMRAYATHPSEEKHIFHIRHLHIGHLAKSFALREAPGNITGHTKKTSRRDSSKAQDARGGSNRSTAKARGRHRDFDVANDTQAEKRMREVVRAQGRLLKKGGVLMHTGTSDFQVAGADELEKLVGTR